MSVCVVWDWKGTILRKWQGELAVDLCGMGAGLHRNRVPGLRGAQRSLPGTRVRQVRAFRDFQSFGDLGIAGRAALLQKQTVINFSAEGARPSVVWRKRK